MRCCFITKFISVFMAVLLVSSLCGCDKKAGVKEKPNFSDEILERVVEADHVIAFIVEDIIAPSVRTVTLNGTALSLTYKKTGYCSVGDYQIIRYAVDGDESKPIDLDMGGNIIRILYTYMTLDVSKNATSDEVLAKLKPELEKIEDISKYEHIEVKVSESGADGFGKYSFSFHNLEDGIVTDYLCVSVSDDGGVSDLQIFNLPDNKPVVNVNEDKLNDVIEAKLMKKHDTDSSKYVSFEKYGDHDYLTVYNGEYYLDCSVRPKFMQNGSETSGFIISLLVPLDLVSD